MTDIINTTDLTKEMPVKKTDTERLPEQQTAEQTLQVDNNEEFFEHVAQKNFNEMLQMITDGLVDPNVTDSNGKSAFSHLVSSLMPKNVLDSISIVYNAGDDKYYMPSKDPSEREMCDQQWRIRYHMGNLVKLGAIAKIEDLFEIAQKGYWMLITQVANANTSDVTKKLNGKTLRQMAEEAEDLVAAQYIGELEEMQIARYPVENNTLLKENNKLLKENNAMLRQILENQKQERLGRAADMKQTRNLLSQMMSYIICATSESSSASTPMRDDIINGFSIALKDHVRD